MGRFRNFLPLAAGLLVAATMLGAPSQAQATFQVRYSINGGAFTTVQDQVGVLLVSGDQDLATVGAIQTLNIAGLSVKASSTSFISTGLSTLDLQVGGVLTDLTITDILVQATITDVNTAPAPQKLTFNFAGSVLPTEGSVSERTFFANNNALFGTTSPITPDLTTPASGVAFFNATPLYSVTTQVHVVLSSTHGIVSISSDSNNIIQPTPAPAGVVLALSGLPLLGLGWLRRRNRIAAQG